MKKKIVFILVLSLLLVVFGGCSNSGSGQGSGQDSGQSTDSSALIPVVVGATPVPHAEILEFVKPKMAEMGYDLQIKEFTDYIQPNLATESGELDANYFQHVPYMEEFNAENGTHLVSVFPVHFEPYALYKGKTSAIADLKDGAIIAVPNDPTNEARALQLIQTTGLIKLKDGAGLLATVNDIVDNPKNLNIKEIEAAQIPRVLPDVDMAVINGNFALQAGLHLDTDAVAVEDKESIGAVTYANPIVVKAGHENDPGILALIKALDSDDVRDFINNKYQGAVVPVF